MKHIVTIILRPTELILAHIRQEAVSIASRLYCPHEIFAYEKIPLTNNEFYESRIYNMKYLVEKTHQFCKQHRVDAGNYSVAVEGTSVTEHIFVDTAKTPSEPESNDQTLTTLLGKDTGHDQYIFYRCSIASPELWQYNLFGMLLGTQQFHITTTTLALIRAFVYKRGTALMPQQLTPHPTLATYLHQGLKSYELINHVKPIRHLDINYDAEEKNLITHFGLYLRGKENL